jgi:hypothetical protein
MGENEMGEGQGTYFSAAAAAAFAAEVRRAEVVAFERAGAGTAGAIVVF